MKLKTHKTETSIVHSLIEFLNYNGFAVWRQNTGGRTEKNKDGSERYIKFGMTGQSDIIGIYRKTGRFVAIEVKKPGKIDTVTPAQQSFLDYVFWAKGIAFATTSIENTVHQLRNFGIDIEA